MEPKKKTDKAKMQLALAWLRDMQATSPADASPSSAARIWDLHEGSVKSRWLRERKKPLINQGKARRGGQNRILSEAQHDAVVQYARDQGRDLGATKNMIFKAIVYLKATETPPAPPPSERWFQRWLKESKVLFFSGFDLN
jgi:hypothetical protein